MQRIDPTTNRITGTVVVGGQLQLEESTAGGGLTSLDEDTTPLWTCTNTDGALNQIDAHAMRVTAMVPAHCDGGSRTRVGSTLWAATSMAWGFGSLWITNFDDDTLWRLSGTA